MGIVITRGAGPISIARPCILHGIQVSNTLNSTRWLHARANALTPGSPPLLAPWWIGANTAAAGHLMLSLPPTSWPEVHVGLSSTQATWTATTDGIFAVFWEPV